MKGLIVLLLVFHGILCQEDSKDAGKISMVSPKDRPYHIDDKMALNITCILDGEGAKIDWLFNGNPVDGSLANVTYDKNMNGPRTISFLYYDNVTLAANQGIYTCKSRDNNADAEVQVWVIEIQPKSAQLTNTTVTLGCLVVNENDAILQWFKNGTQLLNGTKYIISSSSLVINDPGRSDIGPYECRYNSSNKQHVREVYVYAQPEVKPLKAKNMMQGETLTVTCEVVAYPAATVEWFNKTGKDSSDQSPVDLSDSRISVTTINGSRNDTLKIANVEFWDKAYYVCVAINEYGNDSDGFDVKVKDKLAALWPFLGICAEVAILCTIIFIYERRRAKKMEEAEAEAREGEGDHLTNSHATRGGEDVRHRNT